MKVLWCYFRSHHVALLALFVALGGTSYAIAKLPKNSVGSAQITKNAITSLKVKDHALLRRDFKPGQLPQGPRGADGAPGKDGLPGKDGKDGKDGTRLWAVVTAAGSLSRSGLAGISAAHQGASGSGSYHVTFPQDVSQCAWIAGIGSPVPGTQSGTVEVEGVAGQPNQVFVGTFRAPGDPPGDDRAFHLAVFC